jgi:hypothetical protein
MVNHALVHLEFERSEALAKHRDRESQQAGDLRLVLDAHRTRARIQQAIQTDALESVGERGQFRIQERGAEGFGKDEGKSLHCNGRFVAAGNLH